jgi:hypothetical protein
LKQKKKTNFGSNDDGNDDDEDDDDDDGDCDATMTIFPLYSVKFGIFPTYAET